MAFDSREPEPSNPVAAGFSARLSRLRRLLRSAELSLEQALDELDRVTVRSAGVPTDALDCAGGHPPRRPKALPIATVFSVDCSTRASWVVDGIERRLHVSPVRLDLLSLLAESTSRGADGLVGFKTPAAIVHALRARGWHATRRSVIVEIARLRVALGHGGRDLIETRRGLGYRFRVSQPRAEDVSCA